MPTVPQLSPLDFKRRLDSGAPLAVLDVREDDERAICSVPVPPTATDLHVPMNQIPARLDDLRAAASAGPLVVYCHHGVRSLMVARWLAANGVPGVLNLDGGIDAWSLGVDPDLPRY